MCKKTCEENTIEQQDFRFTRKGIRDYSNWGNTQLKVHLARLLEMEYLSLHTGSRGNTFVYKLEYQGGGEGGESFAMNLIDTKKLTYDCRWSGQNGERSGTGRPLVGGVSAGGQTPFLAASTSKSVDNTKKSPNQSEKHFSGEEKTKQIVDVNTGVTA